MKLGLLGTGMIVQDLLSAAEELPFERAHLLTTPHSTEKAEELCRKYHLDGWTTDYEELLSDDIDTVYVALPNHLHVPYAKQALERGKNVILEKPAAVDSEDLKELYSLADQAGCFVLEAMNVHYQPAYLALKEWLPRVGAVKIMECSFCKSSSRYAAFRSGETPPVFDPNKAGGALMDLNVYNINAVTGLFGRPEKLYYSANVERGIDTSGAAVLDYGPFKAVCIAAKDSNAPFRTVIQGEAGTLLIEESLNAFTRFRFLSPEGEEEICPPQPSHRLCAEFQAFDRILKEKDEKAARSARVESLLGCGLLKEARRCAGLAF